MKVRALWPDKYGACTLPGPPECPQTCITCYISTLQASNALLVWPAARTDMACSLSSPQFQVLDLLYEENTITGGTSCMLLMKESEAVDHVQNTITAVMLFDRDLIRALFLDHHAK